MTDMVQSTKRPSSCDAIDFVGPLDTPIGTTIREVFKMGQAVVIG
jgi:hypothetical protein